MLRIPLGSGDRDQTRVISGNRRKQEINGGFVVDSVEDRRSRRAWSESAGFVEGKRPSPIGNLFERSQIFASRISPALVYKLRIPTFHFVLPRQ